MSAVEFIGFIVTIISIFFLIIKRVYDAIYRQRNPEQYEAEEELRNERLQQFMKANQIGHEQARPQQKIVAPPPAPKQITKPKKIQKETLIEKGKRQSAAESRYGAPIEDAYQLVRRNVPSRAEAIINTLPSRREMLVIHEIFGKPLSLRTHTEEIL